MAGVKEILVEAIKVGEHRTRLEGDDSGVEELAASIRRIGLINPLVVQREGESYILVAGHRRLAAVRILGDERVRCIIRADSAVKVKEVALAENLFRLDLSPVEQACAIKDILEKGVMTVPEIARAMHRSENWVGRQIAMLAWPEDVLQIIHAGQLSVSAAANIALVEEDTYREFLLRNAVESGATARTTAAWLQAWRAAQPQEEAVHAEPVPPGVSTTPAVPQAPCLCCATVYRMDQLSHVPICPGCIRLIRDAGRT
ncbi:Stage 0 sporulation protein J [subsurface metagenome]